MLELLLVSLAFLGLCGLCSVIFRIPYAFAPLFCVAFIGAGGFIAAYGKNLHYGMQAMVVLGLAAFVPSLYVLWKRGLSSSTLGIMGTHAFLQLSLIWYFFGTKIRYYDEYYWGNLTKDMILGNGLLQATSPLWETAVPKVHPPLTGLLQAFFSTTLGGSPTFDESSVGIAGFTVLLALFSIVLHLARQRMPFLQALLLAIIVTVAARCFGTPVKEQIYHIGYIEYYQAALMGIGLCCASFMPKSTLRTAALIATVVVLTGTKATSYLFATGFIGVYTVMECVRHYKSTALAGRKWYEGMLTSLRSPLLLLLAMACMHLVWVQYLASVTAAYGATIQAATTEISSDVVQALTLMPTHSKAITPEILHSWGRALLVFPLLFSPWISEEIMSVPFTLIPVTLSLIVALWAGSHILKFRIASEHVIALGMLLVGLLLWYALRIYIAVHWHSMREILAAASYSRYVGAFFASIVVYVTMLFYMQWAENLTKGIKTFTACLVLHACILLTVVGFSPWQPLRHLELPSQRISMQEAHAFIAAQTPHGSRIWFIYQEEDRTELDTLRFLSLPQRHTELILPWTLPVNDDGASGAEGALDVDSLKETAHSKRIDYILLWNKDKDIAYIWQGKRLNTQKQGVLLDMRGQ